MKLDKLTLITSILIFFCDFALANTSTKIQDLEARLAKLEREIKEEKARNKERNPDDLIISLKPTPSFKTADGKNNFAIDGRIMLDAGFATKGKTSEINNDISIRRLWLGFSGKVDEDWDYRGLIGFENDETNIYDAFIRYAGFKNIDIIAGHFFENNGIDVETPNLISSFMERSSGITTFRQLRRSGISTNFYNENFGAKFGIFGSSTNNSSTNNKGSGVSARTYLAPIINQKNHHYLHIGVNATYRTPDSSTNTMSFSSTGNSNVINATLIDTGNINSVNDYYQYMPEIRYQNGPFTLTAEYVKTVINRKAESDLKFHGGYLMASYFLTGENYGYDIRNGTPTAATINKDAFEIAARYSKTDLNNKDILGGSLNSYDFGLNYYLNSNIRFMINYSLNRLNSSYQKEKNPQYLLLRTQLSF